MIDICTKIIPTKAKLLWRIYCTCNNDWFTQTLLIKTESENNQRKTLPIIPYHSFLSPHEQDIAFIIVFYICSNLLIYIAT